ncbi:MAG TPA: DNA translocase FtsK [Mesorhizobium sp.]|jgi:S-DNA-T family DNA segregation ATPase FtsK/SpoIIIE|nr:DNA translocase FtsK [Mesorhizobium sp.]
MRQAQALTLDGEGFGLRAWARRQGRRLGGLALMAGLGALVASLATWNVADPSFSFATDNPLTNALGFPGAVAADLLMQFLGLSAVAALVPPAAWALALMRAKPLPRFGRCAGAAFVAALCAAGIAGCLSPTAQWPLPVGLGGVIGDIVLKPASWLLGGYPRGLAGAVVALILALPALWFGAIGLGLLGSNTARPAAAKARGPVMAAVSKRQPARPAPLAPVAEEEDGEDEEDEDGGALMGLLAHWWLSLCAALRRLLARLAPKRDARRASPEEGRGWRRAAEQVELAEAAEGARLDPTYRARVEPEFFAAMVADARTGVSRPAPRETPVSEDPMEERWEEEVALQPEELLSEFTPSPAPAPAPAPRRAPTTVSDAWVAPALEAVRPDGAFVRAYRSSPRGLARREPPMFDAEPEAAMAEPEMELDLAPETDEPPFDMPAAPVAPPRAADAPMRVRVPAPARPMAPAPQALAPQPVVTAAFAPPLAPARAPLPAPGRQGFEMPSLEFLSLPKQLARDPALNAEALADNARQLEGVLEDFGVKGEIREVRPGPVVTLYELEPAPGIKSSRVIGLADDIARSMSAIAARVAVVPGRNAIGIELPNRRRETVFLREMLASRDFAETKAKLALALGKTIGGEPVIADIAKMPHVLVAGTTGSGKSVAINTMVLSLLYRMTPEECRLIMIDPKMVELSVYDGIPHLLTPVVTDPKKAVVALKWTVREMEDRYRKMSKVGVRNVEGFNARVAQAAEKGEKISRTVQTGFDRHTGEAVYETEELDLEPLPFIVVIIDEVADLMMVAGKDIEGAVQRLGQMARAAGIHVIMATQRPSVDVITGTIKANFPTRISFQVTSKIDSRTILGEMGAEQLLGQGDMLFMAGGGRIQRVHGPFVSDVEVEKVVAHLKLQGAPEYLDAITEDDEAEDEDDEDAPRRSAGGADGGFDESDDPYDQAVSVVLRDGKASTSYIQRRLGIGYNRAASIIERMEKDGIVGPANHAGKREILVPVEEE